MNKQSKKSPQEKTKVIIRYHCFKKKTKKKIKSRTTSFLLPYLEIDMTMVMMMHQI